jgi:hypothetical protein
MVADEFLEVGDGGRGGVGIELDDHALGGLVIVLELEYCAVLRAGGWVEKSESEEGG